MQRTAATAAVPLEPVIETPAADSSCALGWDELNEIAPPTCAEAEDCDVGNMRGHRRAVLARQGPSGSGRFVSLALVVTQPSRRFVCLTASTVGWRYLHEVGDLLAPLPWLADLDRDRESELVVWHRLPWGNSEVDNALYPVVYVLDGDRLVRRDDHARSMRARVETAYRVLADRPGHEAETRACFIALASGLR